MGVSQEISVGFSTLLITQKNGRFQKSGIEILRKFCRNLFSALEYTCRESNPNLRNRNPLFYPLNYKCIYFCHASHSALKSTLAKLDIIVYICK